MMKRLMLTMFLLAGLGLISAGILRAEDQQYPSGNYAPPPQANEVINSQLQELSNKINKIESKQDEILRKLDGLKQDLDVIKVRSSLRT